MFILWHSISTVRFNYYWQMMSFFWEKSEKSRLIQCCWLICLFVWKAFTFFGKTFQWSSINIFANDIILLGEHWKVSSDTMLLVAGSPLSPRQDASSIWCPAHPAGCTDWEQSTAVSPPWSILWEQKPRIGCFQQLLWRTGSLAEKLVDEERQLL